MGSCGTNEAPTQSRPVSERSVTGELANKTASEDPDPEVTFDTLAMSVLILGITFKITTRSSVSSSSIAALDIVVACSNQGAEITPA